MDNKGGGHQRGWTSKRVDIKEGGQKKGWTTMRVDNVEGEKQQRWLYDLQIIALKKYVQREGLIFRFHLDLTADIEETGHQRGHIKKGGGQQRGRTSKRLSTKRADTIEVVKKKGGQ